MDKNTTRPPAPEGTPEELRAQATVLEQEGSRLLARARALRWAADRKDAQGQGGEAALRELERDLVAHGEPGLDSWCEAGGPGYPVG